jgi:hypothetical protein
MAQQVYLLALQYSKLPKTATDFIIQTLYYHCLLKISIIHTFGS